MNILKIFPHAAIVFIDLTHSGLRCIRLSQNKVLQTRQLNRTKSQTVHVRRRCRCMHTYRYNSD